MQIQRYLHKPKTPPEKLREHYVEDSRWEFKWYIGEDFIGVRPKHSNNSESFINGMFGNSPLITADDLLTIIPYTKDPLIRRKMEPSGVMAGNDTGIPELAALVELITLQNNVCMYFSDPNLYGKPSVLVFSIVPPNGNSYSVGRPLPVEIDEEGLRVAHNLEQTLAEIEKTKADVLRKLGKIT